MASSAGAPPRWWVEAWHVCGVLEVEHMCGWIKYGYGMCVYVMGCVVCVYMWWGRQYLTVEGGIEHIIILNLLGYRPIQTCSTVLTFSNMLPQELNRRPEASWFRDVFVSIHDDYISWGYWLYQIHWLFILALLLFLYTVGIWHIRLVWCWAIHSIRTSQQRFGKLLIMFFNIVCLPDSLPACLSVWWGVVSSCVQVIPWVKQGWITDLVRYQMVACELLMMENLKSISTAVAMSGHRLNFTVKEVCL